MLNCGPTANPERLDSHSNAEVVLGRFIVALCEFNVHECARMQ